MRLEKYGYRVSVQSSTRSMMKQATMFKRFLYHNKTKADLADYMAMTLLTYNTD